MNKHVVAAPGNKLVFYSEAKRALAKAARVDEVKKIRDAAAAFAAYAKLAKDTQLIRDATEIKLRAERRGGQMLIEMGDHGKRHDGKGRKERSQPATLKLADLGLSKSQSSRWQDIARMPEKAFEAAVRRAGSAADEAASAAHKTMVAEAARTQKLAKRRAKLRAKRVELLASIQILHGDCREQLRALADASIHCVITSPPYFNLRDYKAEGQIGLEPTPDDYVAELVGVFREVYRVLRNDGAVWMVLGDTYADDKSLYLIPARVAIALQTDGWLVRQEIIWSKPGVIPESVTDRCTRSHECIYMLTKSADYYYDADAIKEPAVSAGRVINAYAADAKNRSGGSAVNDMRTRKGLADYDQAVTETRNKRSVWEVLTEPFPDAHFAVFPQALIEPMVLAGCPQGGTVLDPFAGTGTTGLVAQKHGRSAVLIELNAEYVAMAKQRIATECAEAA
jgi:DNA modification methylase